MIFTLVQRPGYNWESSTAKRPKLPIFVIFLDLPAICNPNPIISSSADKISPAFIFFRGQFYFLKTMSVSKTRKNGLVISALLCMLLNESFRKLSRFNMPIQCQNLIKRNSSWHFLWIWIKIFIKSFLPKLPFFRFVRFFIFFFLQFSKMLFENLGFEFVIELFVF